MKLALNENTWWGTSIDRAEGIRLAKRFGFDAYGVFMQDITPQLKKRMRETLQEVGLPVSTSLTVAPSLGDWNTEIRRMTVQWAKTQMDTGYDLGSKIMIVVPGEYLWEKQEIKPEVQYGWVIEGLRELGDYARSLDMRIGLECETPTYNMLRTIDDLVRMIHDAAHPAIKANVDLVHMFVVGDTPASMEKLKSDLINVHVADCHGRRHAHHPPGRGVVPLKEDLKTLKRMGFGGALEVELEWSPEPEKINEWVEEGYSTTARLMSELQIKR
jgi:D-psicose/D-tagatose/L-ribulose 3-epimerase